MTTRSKLLIVGVLGACSLIGSASAQTAGGTVDVKAGSTVAAGDQSALADQYVVKMQTSSTRVRHLLDDARRQKDVVKTTCLSDKLNQIEVALKSAKERNANLKAAIARGDNDLRNHEFQVLTVLRQRAEQLDAEANQCVGEEIGFPGDTKTTVVIDPNIAPVDPGVSDPGGGTIYMPPVVASPSS